ncbi:uncharacterized protein B0T23DRAFT_2669 [Neurospora hispaniola]|uniref:Uncharacterized protein n=1 Tax=Neurospora hispaniola TaxID=588809 RepID=A0AAJ0IEH0_9PEZI|nr:hypothetical protein B0T23DRAFT_2669 [Neurospora hispaniola]
MTPSASPFTHIGGREAGRLVTLLLDVGVGAARIQAFDLSLAFPKSFGAWKTKEYSGYAQAKAERNRLYNWPLNHRNETTTEITRSRPR